MTWKSKFNWQKLSWLKAISVTVPLSQLSILKQLMSCMNSFGDRNVQVWMHGAPLATINPLRENLGSAAPFWSILQVQWHENFSHLARPLSPAATGFWKMHEPVPKISKTIIDTSELDVITIVHGDRCVFIRRWCQHFEALLGRGSH